MIQCLLSVCCEHGMPALRRVRHARSPDQATTAPLAINDTQGIPQLAMANFRTDQFDNLPENVDRVGAHRGPKVKGRGWIAFAWAVLATAVLVVGGLYVLST